MKTKIGNWLCSIGRHKWAPVEETIKRKDKYTLEAELICTRFGCLATEHGECPNYW